MTIRHIIAAGLVAGSSLAQAAPTQASNASVVAGWTLKAGSVDVLGELDAVQLLLATANSTRNWSLHTSLSGAGGASALLYSPTVGKLALGEAAGGGGKFDAAGAASTAAQAAADVGGSYGVGAGAANGNGYGTANGNNGNGGEHHHGSHGASPTGADAGAEPGAGAGADTGPVIDAGAGQGALEGGSGNPAGQVELVQELVKAGPPPLAQPEALPPAFVPEPSTGMLLLAAALSGSMLLRRRPR